MVFRMGTSRLCLATVLATLIAIASTHNHDRAPSFCGLEPESGMCNGYETRWYFNVKAGTCLRFMYRGCGGNLNNFDTPDACMNVCKHYTEEPGEEKDQLPTIEVVKEETDDSEIDPAKHGITDREDWATLQDVMAQDNMETAEVEPVTEDTKEQGKESMDAVKPADDERNRIRIDDVNDKATLDELMHQDNMEVQEANPAEDEKDEDKVPARIVRTEETDEEVDLERLRGDPADVATLEQLMAQSNFGVDTVEVLDETESQEPKMKVVETIEDDSDIDIDRLHVTDANDLSTLEQLVQQDNMKVEEVIPVEVENKDEEAKEEASEDGPRLKVVRTEEDDSDVDIDRLHITDANDLSTLEQILQQDNIAVEEVVPVEEDPESEDKEKKSEESDEGPRMKVVRTEEDDSDVDIDRLHITDANDLSTLEQILQQDNIAVEEVIPVDEEEKEERKDAEEKLEESNSEEGPRMKVVRTEEDDSDIDMERLHITDANDLSTLQQLLQQDNIVVEEVIPVEEEEEEEEEKELKEEGDNKKQSDGSGEMAEGPLMKVVRTEEDDSDVDIDRLHITDANDLSTLEQILQQDNMVVEEVVPVEEEGDEKSEHEQQSEEVNSKEEPYMKVVRTEEDDSDVDMERLHITDANDRSTLEQLLQQDNIKVEEVIPVEEEAEEREEVETTDAEEGPRMKVVRTEEDDSDVDIDRLHITDANDMSTLEQLLQQDNMAVEEVIPVEEDQESEDKEEKSEESEEGPHMKVIRTEEDDSDVDMERLHITDANDRSTLEQILQQDNMVVEEVIPVEEDEEEETEDTEEERFIDVVRTEEDDSDVDLEKLHITDGNDRATLEQLLNQENVAVEEVVPVEEEKPATEENLAYKKLDALRNKFRKPMWMRRKKPMMFFSKKVMEEETETTETTFLHPRAASALPRCCTHRVDPGPCKANMMQWYYDPKLQTCVTFTYGGCGGNRNRFDTIGDCLRKCGGITRASPIHAKEAPPPGQQMMMDPYKAILSSMTPRIKPFLAIFANMRKEQQTTMAPQPPRPEPVRRLDPGVIRVLINRGRPMPGYEYQMPPRPRPSPPSNLNLYKHSMQRNTFSPQFRKEVVMSPQSHDNRYQSHAMPHNKVTLVQVFVNKHGRRGGKSRWEPRHQEPYHGPQGQEMPTKDRSHKKAWKKEMRRRGKTWGPPQSFQHQHDGMGMHSHPIMPPHYPPFTPGPVKPWWARFGRPVTYTHEEEGDPEYMERLMQTTTYPPDYPKWDSRQVSRPNWQEQRHQEQQERQEQVERQEQDVIVEEQEPQEDNEPSYVCMMPLETGPCKALVEKWYFNQETGKCHKFYYGGCRGNGNRFDSAEECQKTCKVASEDQQETTPYPDDVIVVTENVYATHEEYETAPEENKVKEPVEEEKEEAVTPDPMAAVPEVKDVEQPLKEAEIVANDDKSAEKQDSDAPTVGRLVMTSEMEYIIIITAMCLVGVIVIILVSFTVAHLFGKLKKSKKERVIEAVVASNPTYGTSDFPKLVYYGNTIVPPAPHPDVPDVHTLNKIDLRDEV